MADTAVGKAAEGAVDGAQSAARQAAPWIEPVARGGFAAKGIVYGLIGVLALLSAFGNGGEKTDQRGAIDRIAEQPYGKPLLIAIGVGLVGYALWRILQAIFDPEDKGAIKRIGYVLTAAAYGGLGVLAFKDVMGGKASEGGQSWTAGLLGSDLGRLAVLAVGLLVIGMGIVQLVNGWKANFQKVLKLEEMSEGGARFAVTAGRLGLIARGIVFMLIGAFLVNAARRADPNKAGGLDEALRALASAPYGPWLLGLVALGLIMYAAYQLVEARYRRMTTA